MPISALRPRINTEAKASPEARYIGLAVSVLIVIKKLILTSRTYNKATRRTAIGVDLIIERFEYW